jgi:hypothetical protein
LFFGITKVPDPSYKPCDHANLFQEDMTLGDSPDSPRDSATSYRERRRAPRYAFVATTELTDSGNATKWAGTVTEISRAGCYVDILNTLPVGEVLNVRISCDQGTFVTRAKVLYVQERIGMGVVFLDPPKDQLEILESWLVKLPPLVTS